jgi:hypothetical protein
MNLQDILINWIPLGFGIIGILILLAGILNLITGRDKALNSIFSGLFIILIAIGLRWLMQEFIIPNLF